MSRRVAEEGHVEHRMTGDIHFSLLDIVVSISHYIQHFTEHILLKRLKLGEYNPVVIHLGKQT